MFLYVMSHVFVCYVPCFCMLCLMFLQVMSKKVVGKSVHTGVAEAVVPRLVRAELDSLLSLHHEHIVKLFDWFESEDCWYVVTETLGGGDITRMYV